MITIRVYGILVNDNHQILVSDELIRGMYITKFCGGGLEEGEGTRDCLKREFLEEMNLKVEVGEHIYTTDYYQPSAFKAGDQILSIYYKVKPIEAITTPLRSKPFDFDKAQLELYKSRKEIETFRFVSLQDFDENCMTLPIDKIVAKIIRQNYNLLSLIN
ncbi:MAG: NUDIX hydrolase [Ferruginibacter sp.]|nr:NUDIX hydrolase [Ferruginibacter sp.]